MPGSSPSRKSSTLLKLALLEPGAILVGDQLGPQEDMLRLAHDSLQDVLEPLPRPRPAIVLVEELTVNITLYYYP